MSFTRNQIAILVLGLVLVAGVVLLFIYGSRERGITVSGNITFWGVFDSTLAMSQAIAAYRAQSPYVNVSYRQVDPASYESELIDALASGKAPDVIMFHNSWLPKHFNKIVPFSSELITIDRYRALFPTIAEQDFAPDGKIFALPLYIDTLALFYNQDIFDNAAVALPPKTWGDFEKLIPKLRQMDKLGRIQKAAAAIGGSSRSINRATDLLGLLMLQTGTQMVNDDFTNATFASREGLNALNFYTKFANPISPSYTWGDSFPYSLDSFANGDTAIIFNYAYQADLLKEKNPFLNFHVTGMLQPDERTQEVNYGNYWGLAVTVGTRNLVAAQDFALKMAGDPAVAEQYLLATKRPPALRSLISKYSGDPEVGIFARQALTARSWPQADGAQIERIFSDMVNTVLTGRRPATQALEEAAGAVSQVMLAIPRR
ncbi:MAG: extracellular solute-binding protein [Patescibacteria group bacterium]